MKKLLYLLLLTPIIYLASCSKSGVTPPENINNDNDDNIEEVIVGKIWKLLNLDEEWFILDNDSTYLKKDYQCDSLEQNGTWQLKDSVLSFKYTIGPLEYIERFTIVEYNDSIVKVNVDTSATLDINIIFEIVPEGWGIFGCMNPDYANYNPEAVCPAPCNQGGCMDPIACNYNEFATYDDGSCQLPDGCTDPIACNYDPTATCNDGSCQLPDGCTDPIACNYDPTATCDDGSCQLPDGCTEATACNYDPTATCDDGSCCFICGCMDLTAFNYDPSACFDDGSCYFATYVPDDVFEQILIDLGYDDVLDDYVNTANIETITSLQLNYFSIGQLQIYDLTGIEDFTALMGLNLEYQPLTSLDVSNNLALTNLRLFGNQLTSLDVSNNLALINLSCSGNAITSIDITNNTQLKQFICINTEVSSFDFSNNILLEYINVSSGSNAPLSNLDVSNNINLKSLLVYSNLIQNIDLSNNTVLERLEFTAWHLIDLDLSNNINLEELDLDCGFSSNNTLMSLDLSNNTSLTMLNTIGLMNLNCIKVSDVSWANSIPDLTIEPQQYFSLSCP